jgi:hypothetical protein
MIIYLSNAVATSAGPGPGPKTLPRDEALWLIRERLAVAGDVAPTGYLGNGVTISPATGRGYGAG